MAWPWETDRNQSREWKAEQYEHKKERENRSRKASWWAPKLASRFIAIIQSSSEGLIGAWHKPLIGSNNCFHLLLRAFSLHLSYDLAFPTLPIIFRLTNLSDDLPWVLIHFFHKMLWLNSFPPGQMINKPHVWSRLPYAAPWPDLRQRGMSPCPCVPILEKRLRTIRIPQTGNSLKEGRLYGGCKRKPKFWRIRWFTKCLLMNLVYNEKFS